MPSENTLPKQLLHMDLSQGVTERDRPETADPASTFTRVENLIQDQNGAYIKRYGTPYLAGGGAFGGVSKIMRLRDGLGVVQSTGSAAGLLSQYGENSQTFGGVGFVPDFIVAEADQITSSFTQANPVVVSVASCTKYHAVIYQIGGTVTVGQTSGYHLAVYDRAAGVVVYDVTMLNGTIAPMMVFVDDTYLHVYDTYAGIYLTVYAPSLGTVSTRTQIVGSGSGNLTDIESGTGQSYILYVIPGSNLSQLVACSNAGGVQQFAVTLTGTSHIALSSFGTSIWSWNGTVCEARSKAAIATVVTASSTSGPTSVYACYRSATSSTSFTECKPVTGITFGGSTVSGYSLNGAIIPGWTVASRPFLMNGTGSPYAHLVKSSGLTVNEHVVAKLNYSVNVVNGNDYSSVRPAAVLEPMNAVSNSNVLKYVPVNGVEVCPHVPVETVVRGYAYVLFVCRQYLYSNIQTQVFGGQNYISGGAHQVFDGTKLQDSGFHDMPVMNAVQSATAGPPAGSYKHVAVYRYVDGSGAVTWSRTSVNTSVVTTSAKGYDIVVLPPTMTSRDTPLAGNPVAQLQSVEVYRTISGGTQYYLCGSSQLNTPATGLATQVIALNGSGFYGFTDVMTDAVLQTQQALFRQPGTAGAALDRYPPPAGNILCQHKDRLFTTDPYGIRVYYSSFFVDGETAWYNPQFSFLVHGASGPITALASMDGRLFIFKSNGVFYVDGDGPAESGPTGNEYTPPIRLATDYGCVDQRSVFVGTEGIYYRSSRGIELLTSSLQVTWIGDKVQNTIRANPKVTGTAVDQYGRIHFGFAASDTGTALQSSVTGGEALYDPAAQQWSINYFTDTSAVYGNCFQDVARANLAVNGDVLVYADPQGSVRVTSMSSGLDSTGYSVPWALETGWLRIGQQARQRFTRALFLGKRRDAHSLTISAAYNFVDAYTQVSTFTDATLSTLPIEEVEIQFASPQALAVRLLIQETAGTNRGVEPLGITIEAQPKQNAPTLAATSKA